MYRAKEKAQDRFALGGRQKTVEDKYIKLIEKRIQL